MTKIKISVYWEGRKCKAFRDGQPDIIGSGKDEKAAVGDLVIKLGLVAVKVIKKIPVT